MASLILLYRRIEMNFRIVRKTISVVATLLLAVAMPAACTNLNIPGASSSAKGASAEAANSAGSAANAGPMGKYDPMIDITFVRCIDEDLAANVLPKCPGETMDDNRWTRLYEEKLGIHIQYVWTVYGGYSSDAYTQKFNVTLASGDLPDVVIVNATQLIQLTEANMITDMTRYFNEYSTDLLKKVYSQSSDSALDPATFQGRLMAIPSQDDELESAQYLWIRADWLKKLGLDPPRTMDNLLKISEAFTTKDPDGNGKNDTYGLAVTKDLYSNCMGTEGFFAGYHAYPNMWIKDSSGKLVYGSIQPETKTALEKLAEMYRCGQIDEEFGVKDASKVAETIAAGKVGIDFGAQWNPMYPLISNYNNDSSADWTGYAIVSADSQPVKVPLKFCISEFYAVKNGYEHPEAVIKMLNLYTDIDCGEMSKTYYNAYINPAENDNVGVWKFSPIMLNPPLTNYTSFLSMEKARQTNDYSKVTPAAVPVVASLEAYEKGDKTQWCWEKIYGVNGVFRVMNDYQANHSLMPDSFTGAPTKTMVERGSALDKMEKDTFIRIIIGAATIDEFDKFVRDWNKIGGDRITREVNDWYNARKK
jgi:putative aldouronate transport system substrate-binding protein